MQKSPASSNNKISQDAVLYGHLSTVRFCSAIALLLITFVVLIATNDRREPLPTRAIAQNAISSGMPLP